MKTQTLVIGVGVGALVLAGCQKQTAQTGGQSAPAAIKEMAEMGQAIKSGEPVVCTITGQDGAVVTYQLKGGKMRADGMQLGREGTTGSMINDMAFIYTWESGSAEGMKLALNRPTPAAAVEADEAAEEPLPPAAPDFSDEADVREYEGQGFAVDCQKETIDDAVFVPPAEVTFTDPTQMMQGAMEQVRQALPSGMGGMENNAQFREQLQQFQGEPEGN